MIQSPWYKLPIACYYPVLHLILSHEFLNLENAKGILDITSVGKK